MYVQLGLRVFDGANNQANGIHELQLNSRYQNVEFAIDDCIVGKNKKQKIIDDYSSYLVILFSLF